MSCYRKWMMSDKISFRPLKKEDLPVMLEWLSDRILNEIWFQGRRVSMPDLEAKYLPRINGFEPVAAYIILRGEKPFGYAQAYSWKDHQKYASYLLPEEAGYASLDIFIGEEEYRGKGIGPSIIRQFLREILFVRYETDNCLITPLLENARAIRSYEKAGFSRVRVIEHPDEPSAVQLMVFHRYQLI